MAAVTETPKVVAPKGPRADAQPSSAWSFLASLLVHGLVLGALHLLLIQPLLLDLQPASSARIAARLASVPAHTVREVVPPAMPEPEPDAPSLEGPSLEDPPAPAALPTGSAGVPAPRAFVLRPPRAVPATPARAESRVTQRSALQPPTSAVRSTPPPAAPVAVASARVLKRFEPEYPSRCRRRGHHGQATVGLTIDAQGRGKNPQVVRSAGCARLDRAALTAVTRFRFAAARRGSTPVASRREIVFRFRLD